MFPPTQPLGPTTTIFAVYAQDTVDQHSRSFTNGLRFFPSLFRSVGGKKNPSLASLSGMDPAPHIVFVGGRSGYDQFLDITYLTSRLILRNGASNMEDSRGISIITWLVVTEEAMDLI